MTEASCTVPGSIVPVDLVRATPHRYVTVWRRFTCRFGGGTFMHDAVVSDVALTWFPTLNVVGCVRSSQLGAA